jgi:hypothetical protein
MIGTRGRLDRAVAGVGLLALASCLTTLASGELDPFRLRGWGVVLTLALGALAVAAGWLALRPLALAAGVGFLAAAVLQLAQLRGEAGISVEHGVLGGNASTFALWLGLGVGLAVLATAPDPQDG